MLVDIDNLKLPEPYFIHSPLCGLSAAYFSL